MSDDVRKIGWASNCESNFNICATILCSTNNYIWTDAEGTARVIQQAEGGEQGDPLMPALFCLGIHDALHNVSANLRADEHVLAYLDDIYIVASRDRTRVIYD